MIVSDHYDQHCFILFSGVVELDSLTEVVPLINMVLLQLVLFQCPPSIGN